MPDYIVPTKATGDTFTAGDYMRYLRHNFNVGVPGIFSAKGDMAAASAIRSAGALAAGSDYQTLQSDSDQALGLGYSSPVGVSVYTVFEVVGSSIYGITMESGKTYNINFAPAGGYTNAVSNFLSQSHTFFDPVVATDKIVIPAGLGGIYMIYWQCTWYAPTGTTDTTIATTTIGGDIAATNIQVFPPNPGGDASFLYRIFAQTMQVLEAGDYISVSIKQTSTGDYSVQLYGSCLDMYKLR